MVWSVLRMLIAQSPAGRLGKLTNMAPAAGYNNFAAGPGPGRGVENLIAQLRLEHRAEADHLVQCIV